VADEVASRVYYWEHNYVAPRQRPMDRLLTKTQCHEYIFRACTRTGTRLPKLKFKPSHLVPCTANMRDWEITLAEWGHSAHAILHETAHLATFDAVMRGENGHGPAFVRQAIEFYDEFMGIDPVHLLASAAKLGIDVGPPSGNASSSSVTDSPFGDDVF